MLMTHVDASLSRKPGHLARFGSPACLCMAGLILSLASSVQAYDSQSDGSDGALTLSPGQMRQIDLSMAATGPWNMPSPVMEKGVYDPEQWAVVFKYSSVTIPNGATVTFKNHPKNPPVVWLVSGNVTIDGKVELDGKDGTANANRAAGGPGGFSGGVRLTGSQDNSAGEGPGGGQGGNCDGAGGGFGTGGIAGDNAAGGSVYGSPTLVPLIGGSGGGGYGCGSTGVIGGGGGGGAILIASSGTITLGTTGTISAEGGFGQDVADGSGGAIRLIADQVNGGGTLSVRSGDPAVNFGLGRIRIETLPNGNLLTGTVLNHLASSYSSMQGPIFPGAMAPKLRVVSIKNVNAPNDPFGGFSASEDVLISSSTTTADVVVETQNVTVQAGMMVRIRVVPAFGDSSTVNTPQLIDQGNGTARATATNVTIPQGRSVVQLRLVLPQ